MGIANKRLLGTNVSIQIVSQGDTGGDIKEVFHIFENIQDEFSRFSSDSDLSALNRDKRGIFSCGFIELLQLSKKAYKDTGGYFNPLINLKNIGYSQSFETGIFLKEESSVNLSMNDIQINGKQVILDRDQNLDFGAIAKGYAVDQAAKYLQSQGHKDFCINAGGDIYCSGNNKQGNKWCVGIEHPFMQGKHLASIELSNMSVSTSGSYKRNWSIDGKKYHHISNPKGDIQPDGIVSVTLLADTTYISDAYATAIFNMGITKALRFAQTYNLALLMIGEDLKIYRNTLIEERFNLQIL